MSGYEITLAAFAVLAALCVSTWFSEEHETDRSCLLDGVQEIASPEFLSNVLVFGKAAFPVVVGKSWQNVLETTIAAARFGKGRVVAFGSTSYFEGEHLNFADTGKFFGNALRWAAGGNESGAPLRVGVYKMPKLHDYLRQQGFEVEVLDKKWLSGLADCAVICCEPSALSTKELNALAKYIRAGGGLLAGDNGFYWLDVNIGKSLFQNGSNRLLSEVGILWTDEYITYTTEKGLDTRTAPSALFHVRRALEVIEAHVAGDQATPSEEISHAVWTLTRGIMLLPGEYKKPLLRLLKRVQKQPAGDCSDLKKNPANKNQALPWLLLALQVYAAKNLPAGRVRAHPSAQSFPGDVPAEAPRIGRTLEIDTKVAGWHSTGLYAAPGEVIEVAAPVEVKRKNLQVRIGAHTDGLWGQVHWRRAPEITRAYPLKGPVTQAANAFGGLIYIEAPKQCKLGTITVSISNAVEAPYYVKGQTDAAEWRNSIRNRPAPWAEFQGDSIIFTLPAAAVRELENPEEMMKFWDDVLDQDADLAAMPRRRPCQERIVSDEQISVGYMHNGYPIMGHLDLAAGVIDVARLREGGNWGVFHELGHNHQALDWTFDATWEVTENLFTLYNYEFSCDVPCKTWPPEAPAQMLEKYFAGGADFKKWTDNPFLGLLTYYQLKEAFGWEAYKRVFAEYRALPAAQRPKNDDEKRDQWMVRFSRAVGRNLGPFFQAWDIPTSEQARKSIANLPVWMPDNFPPQ